MKKLVYVFFAVILLSSCNEYQPLIKYTIDGITFDYPSNTIGGQYLNLGGFTNSVVSGTSGNDYVQITVKNNIAGTYTAGSGQLAEVVIKYENVQYSTTNSGGSGTVKLLTTGGNLIEGEFNGTIASTTGVTVNVSNGKFSARAL